MHLNDCQGPVGCHRYRHGVPGEGTIGAGLASVGWHPSFHGVPAIPELALDDARRDLAYLTLEGTLEYPDPA